MSKCEKTWGVPVYKKYSLKCVTMGQDGNLKKDKNSDKCGNAGSTQPSCPF